MHVISIACSKGGTGKTTTALQLAEFYSKKHRVLLIDLDPQASLTDCFALESSVSGTIADVLTGTKLLSEIVMPVKPGIDIAPANDDLRIAETRLNERPGGEFRLRKVLQTVADRYDFVIVDTIGATSQLVYNALVTADVLIVPVRPEGTDIKAVAKFMDTVEAINDLPNVQITRIAILPTHYAAQSKHEQESLALIRTAGYRVLTPIGRSVKVSESMFTQKTLAQVDSSNERITEYAAVANEVIQWLNQKTK